MKLLNHLNKFCIHGCKNQTCKLYRNLFVLQLSLIVVFSQPCQEGNLTPNPKGCDKYFLCQHGSRVKMECGGGLHFKVATGTCEIPSVAGCNAGTAKTTATVAATSTRTTLSTGGLITGSGTIPIIPATTKPNDFKIICYFTDWATYRQGNGAFNPENVDPSLCTHIIYSFALLDNNTSLMKIADNNTAIDKKFYEKLVAFKSKGAKVNLAIGGWTDSSDGRYSVMVNDPVKRAAFVKNAVAFLKQYNFDGLDLDWEYPRCWQGNCNAGPASDTSSFALLVTELRAALPPGALLSAAVSVYKPVIEQAYDVLSLSKNLDWIGVMAYDLHTGWDSKTGHIAPLLKRPDDPSEVLNIDYGMKYWKERGADPSKLIMGVPLYGNSFFLQNASVNGLNSPSFAPGGAGPFTQQVGMLAYYEICQMLPTYTVVSDKTNSIGPYAYNGTGAYYTQWISYDDAAMAQVKANYVKTNKFGGVMVWALDFDDFNDYCEKGKYPILTALRNTLRPIQDKVELPSVRSSSEPI